MEYSNIHQKAIELQRKSVRQCADFDQCLSLCRDSFLELNHAIHDGQELVMACTLEHWCKSAVVMSNPIDLQDPGHNQFLRSPFGIYLKRFLWSLDVVENAFMILTRNPNFRYRERLNLHFIDNGSSSNDGLTFEGLTDLLMGNKFTQHQAIAEFLLKKLNEPCPRLNSLPESNWLDYKDMVRIRHLGHGDHTVIDEYEWFGFSVAVKVISGVEKEFVAKKGATLALAKHPYVVKLIGCAYREEDRTGMLVLELIDQDLQSLLSSCSSIDSPFNFVVAIDIMLQVAKAIEYLHDCQIVHGDLRIANLLNKLSKKFQVKVSNFQQTKYKFHGTSRSSQCAGKFDDRIRWRAPEVIGG
uniref:Protein kinase domain-containing protein n=2 Tax=Physcomitrium patens TaxID=3218 RepID=A0A7I4AX73_PHYPA